MTDVEELILKNQMALMKVLHCLACYLNDKELLMERISETRSFINDYDKEQNALNSNSPR